MKTTPCVGCGYCCVKVTCTAGIEKFGVNKKPCQGLIWNDKDGRHWCKLGIGNDQAAHFYRNYLHMGAGCSSTLFNDWRTNIRDRTKSVSQPTSVISPIPPIMQVFLKCLAKQFVSPDVLYNTLVDFKREMSRTEIGEEKYEQIELEIKRCFDQNRQSFMKEFF